MLQLDDVTLRRGPRVLFEGADLRVHAGQRLGLVGPNGCGKSSLLALLLGELETDHGEVRHEPGAVIAHVAQSSPESDRPALDWVMDGDEPLRRLQREISECEAHGDPARLPRLHEQMHAIDGYAAEQRAARLLAGLGFAAGEVQNAVDTFSGGWRMRLALARALMCRSDILLLDEPTNHLDLPAILWLESWLKRYEGILLLVSHDRDFLDAVCTHIAAIERGEMALSTGNYSDHERLRAERLATQAALYERQQKEIRHMQGFVDRFRYKASKARQAQSRLKMLEKMTRIAPAHVDSPFHFAFQAPEKQPHQLLALESVTAGYDEAVLTDVRLALEAGDRLGLLGVNGAGKSTLVKALATGETLLGGERIVHPDCRIGYFAQHQLDQLVPADSPMNHLARVAPDLREQELRDYLGGFGFSGDMAQAPVAPFSGGEKARLVLALLVRRRPNLLLLDEPTNHLDLDMRHALSVALAEYEGALVVISHDRHLLRSVCDRFSIVHDASVEDFGDELDRYPAWLAAREDRDGEAGASDSTGKTAPGKTATAAPSRRDERRREAAVRARLKPHRDAVKTVETQLAGVRAQVASIDERLADEDLYQDAGRQAELANLVREQGLLRARLEKLEGDWLEASEDLEQAESRNSHRG